MVKQLFCKWGNGGCVGECCDDDGNVYLGLWRRNGFYLRDFCDEVVKLLAFYLQGHRFDFYGLTLRGFSMRLESFLHVKGE